jgi:hypothetical protein
MPVAEVVALQEEDRPPGGTVIARPGSASQLLAGDGGRAWLPDAT